MILNLKELNTHVKYTKFKMDHIDKVVSLLRPHDVMASLDLISAYGQVHLDPHHQKFFNLCGGADSTVTQPYLKDFQILPICLYILQIC